MKTLVALCIAIILSGFAHADAIDDFVNQELASQHIPGVAIAIIEDGVLIRAQGYGFANVEHEVPVHADTIFQSGSIGKQFTATAVMLMVEAGKLKLDESIRSYLPDSPQSWGPITVRRLLNHTAGLPANPGYDLKRDYIDDELLKIFYGLKLEFPPGKRWSYSNTGYELLGILVKKVGGQSYGEVLKERVFAPLHMDTARLISERDIVPNRAAGYELTDAGLRNQEWVAPTANSTGDGALYLTVLDFAKWDAALRAGKILMPQSWAEVYRPAALLSGHTYPYGFAWFLEQSAGQAVRQHSGAWQGFTTFFIRYLGDQVSVVVLTNLAGANPGAIARGVAGLYKPKLALPPAAPIEDREPERTARADRLLGEIASGTVSQRDFGGEFGSAPAAEFAAGMDYYRQQLQALGTLQELRLFAVSDRGDDRHYRYRARFEKGIINFQVNWQPDGLISSFDTKSVPNWTTPISP
jgi:CubicO group peptidase (beta-lactamase class C family)